MIIHNGVYSQITTLQFMLLTNIAVAQQIAVSLPEQALLRRHDAPIERRLVSPRATSYIYQAD